MSKTEKPEKVTIYLAPGVFRRLRLAAAETGQGNSELANALLDKHLPHLEVKEIKRPKGT